MIVMYTSAAADKMKKPVICSKCKRGKLGSIPENSKTISSRRGRPPPEKHSGRVQVKCPVCGELWTFTIEK